jgi:hypothetical protein
MEEHNNTANFDGSWGIYDIPFMQYFASELNIKKEPFFTTFFSLSSHPPYVLPKDYKHQFEKIEIRETIKYTDDAMQKFFKSIQDKEWFKNTLFVITADHTSGVNYNKTYKNRIGRYAIPLLLFKGDAQIIRAGNGISHAEEILDKSEIFQIWFDPDISKTLNKPATYSDYKKKEFPVIDGNNMKTTIIKGEKSPFEMDSEEVEIKEYRFNKGDFELELDNKFIYSFFLINGSINLKNKKALKGTFIKIENTDHVSLEVIERSLLFEIRTPKHLTYSTYFERFMN